VTKALSSTCSTALSALSIAGRASSNSYVTVLVYFAISLDSTANYFLRSSAIFVSLVAISVLSLIALIFSATSLLFWLTITCFTFKSS
jgi:hypothetical protein